MKLYCPRSAISYTCNVGYGHGTVIHPTFAIPIKALIKANLAPFVENKLTPEQIHLFGCALLAKLPVIWEAPLRLDQWADSWLGIIENLATVAMRYDDRNRENLPRFRITKETAQPQPIRAYISEFNRAITSLKESSAYESSFIKDRAEEAILRILRLSLGNTRESNKLPTLISQWAATVGNFPRTEIPINDSGLRMSLREYWKGIIEQIFQAKSPLEVLGDNVELEDIKELLEHCEQNIEVGTLHSLVLLKKLRTCAEVLQEFRPRKVVTRDSGGIVSNLLEDSAPEKEYQEGEPKASDYRSIAAYLAAKKQWSVQHEQ